MRNSKTMTQKNIQKAFALAEKEEQEKEIQKIKTIVKTYLEKIREKKKKRDGISEEIRILEKDLDDMKSGRLDLIEDRQKKDEKAREISIVIVNKIEKEYVPYYPWRSPWIVEIKPPYQFVCDTRTTTTTTTYPLVSQVNSLGSTIVSDSSGKITDCFLQNGTTSQFTGTQFANFTKGSYDVDGNTINL